MSPSNDLRKVEEKSWEWTQYLQFLQAKHDQQGGF